MRAGCRLDGELDPIRGIAKTIYPSGMTFGVRQMFYATALLASAMAIHPMMLAIAGLVLLAWVNAFRTSELTQNGCFMLFVLILSGCGFGLFLPSSVSVHQADRWEVPMMVCTSRASKILEAIRQYESRNGHYPTNLVVETPDGAELEHSWRVLVLPYLGLSKAHAEYDFNSAWDSPRNTQVMSAFPNLFSCPAHSGEGETAFKLVVGSGTAFDLEKPIGRAAVVDGTTATVALVEDARNPVPWLKPEDLSPAAAAKLMNSRDSKCCPHHSVHSMSRIEFGMTAAFLDGRVFKWHWDEDCEIIDEDFLVADGNPRNLNRFGGAKRVTQPQGVLALFAFLILSALPMFRFRW